MSLRCRKMCDRVKVFDRLKKAGVRNSPHVRKNFSTSWKFIGWLFIREELGSSLPWTMNHKPWTMSHCLVSNTTLLMRWLRLLSNISKLRRKEESQWGHYPHIDIETAFQSRSWQIGKLELLNLLSLARQGLRLVAPNMKITPKE